MKRIHLIKFGGSVITDKTKPFTANSQLIFRLAKEFAEIQKQSNDLFVLGNGAGSFGHVPAHDYCLLSCSLDETTRHGMSVTHDGVNRLNTMFVSSLIDQKVPAMGVMPLSCFMAEKGEVTEFESAPLLALLSMQMVPVFYGDIVTDGDNGYSVLSTDTIMSYLALFLTWQNFKVVQVIHVSAVDGVLDSHGKTIPHLTSSDQFNAITGVQGKDVTGGMQKKVDEAFILVKEGIQTVIINGNREHELQRVIEGKKIVGTIIK